MRNGFRLLTVLLLITTIVYGQDKKLTLRDAVYMNRELLPESLKQLQFMGDSDDFVYVENNSLIKQTVKSSEADTILRIDELNARLTEINEDSIRRFPRIKFRNDQNFYFNHKSKIFSYDLNTDLLKVENNIDEKAGNKDVNPVNYTVAYTKENDLYIVENGNVRTVAESDDPGIVYGQTVHRVEFGIHTGTFWSPNGEKLAFYRKDETMVDNYPLVDIKKRIAKLKNEKYPMAGEKSHHVTIGVYDLKSDETMYLKTGKPDDQYLTSVTWGPEGKYIYVALLNRDQNHLRLNKYEVGTGELVKTLFEEKDSKWVEPENPLYFLNTRKDQFVWFSERDGFNHLYLYDSDGRLIRKLTSGNWAVTGLLGFDEKERTVFFTSTKKSPIEKHIYSVPMGGGKITQISVDEGTHSGIVSSSGDYVIDKYSNLDIASATKLLSSKGKEIRTLMIDEDPLQGYDLGEMSIFTIEDERGPDLYARLIRPADFEAGKRYPVIIYVYGGPHAQLVTNSWLGGAGLFLNYLAQQGYVVFTLDNRGTANRGLEFEQSIFRKLGDLEVEDQMKGVEYLKSLDFVDHERIGVNGWSYGGFMTISMMLKNPGVFKTGVAGGPVIDWKWYEVMYGERYMDTPEENPEGYKKSSLLNYVDKLDDKLLIIHGTMDPTVVWQHSLSFVNKAVDEGVQLDYFVYPGHPHNVRGKDRKHLYEKIFNYFEDYLR